MSGIDENNKDLHKSTKKCKKEFRKKNSEVNMIRKDEGKEKVKRNNQKEPEAFCDIEKNEYAHAVLKNINDKKQKDD